MSPNYAPERMKIVPAELPRVSVGIAAYNAELNIAALLRALCSQLEDHIVIAEIIVHSDQSTDRTLPVVRECMDPRLVIIESPDRRGFAASVRAMLSLFTGDVFVMLNDDIQISDRRFVEKAALAIVTHGAGLAGMNLQPLAPRTFIERAFVSTFRVYERIREAMPDPNNSFTCDGGALSLSPQFAGMIEFPANAAEMGNLDAFLYFSCLRAGFIYRHVPQAVANYRSPATLRDYLRRTIRNKSQERILKKLFGKIVSTSFRPPWMLYWKSITQESLTNPLGAAFVFVTGFYVAIRAHFAALNASPTWEVVESSKELK
jgi:glycosyltransferase involved in cell wall biosynthesis